MAKEKILVVDDQEHMRKFIRRALESENMIVSLASGGNEAIEIINSSNFDLIILDVVMDDLDGFEVVKRLRNLGINIPIFLLSGKDEDYNKILGLGLGADDYITKPFSTSVLCAKVKAHIRRNKATSSNSNNIIVYPFNLDLNSYRLFKHDVEIHLSSKEIKLMNLFLKNPNQIFSKDQIYQNIWNNVIVDDRTIMVYIWHLRNKIEDDPRNPKYLKNVWGIGYKFSTECT